jgi:phage N-6-adenine-methyltransferase
MLNDSLFSSKTDQWSTPQDFFDAQDAIHHFTLDVCADATNHKCDLYFTKEDDGLAQPWSGICWMNPPYGRTIGQWVEKAHRETETGNAKKVVCLLPARTDTRYFHDYCLPYGRITFLKGRLKFGDATNSAPFPSMVVVFEHQPKS